MENSRGNVSRERKALRPSQLRLTNDDVSLPPRLFHLRNLPWLDCYKRQLKSENKSPNTQKSYISGLRSYVETILPGEDVLSEADYNSMTIHDLAQRMMPLNGRIDLWTHSLSDLRPTTYNARLAAARHLLKWLGHRWPEHLTRARTGKRLPRTLTRRELTMVLDAARTS
jgi:hypothetical protein